MKRNDLKIAVCVSGLVNTKNKEGSFIRNNQRQREIFPDADFYYATWNSYETIFRESFPDLEAFYFEEPTMNYHPYFDIPKEQYCTPHYSEGVQYIKRSGNEKWSAHHTKQILIHSYLLDRLPKEYDIIVRTRFDAHIWGKADFTLFIEDSYINNRANGFAVTRKEKFATYYPGDDSSKMKHWMLDQLIIHPPKLLNTSMVYDLHKNKLLHAAEYGWYQVLSKPHGDNHKNNHGWVNHDKNVLPEFLIQ